jgi:glycerophosphoryl diester phosphodiesterase
LAPANTLASYAEAIRLGCDLVEVDVQPTADGVLVLLHDNDIVIDSQRRPVAALTLPELRQAAPNVPTLAEALALLGDRAIPLLDLKGVGFEAQLAAAVEQAGVLRAIVCGRPLSSLLATHDGYAAIATSLTFDTRELEGLHAAAIAELPTEAVTLNHRRLTAGLVDLLHAQGVSVLAWTVDETPRMQELAQIGVDGITTNRPDLLAAAFPR